MRTAGAPSSTTTDPPTAGSSIRIVPPRRKPPGRTLGKERKCRMSVELGITPPGRAAAEVGASAVEFRYTQTEGFVDVLRRLGASLIISTYQANKVLVCRAAGAGLSLLVRTFERPMGLAADARRRAIGTRDQIWLLRNA